MNFHSYLVMGCKNVNIWLSWEYTISIFDITPIKLQLKRCSSKRKELNISDTKIISKINYEIKIMEVLVS